MKVRRATIARRVVMVALFTIVACDKPKQSPAASVPTGSTQAVVDSIFATARIDVLADTAGVATRQLNVMSAPINTLQLSARATDSLRWTMSSDSCALLVVSRKPSDRQIRPGDDVFFAAEWYGNGGFGRVSEIAPSPNWTWMAFGHLSSGPAKARHDSAATPVIEDLIDPCAGEGCDLGTIAPGIAGWHVGWTSDGIALFAARESPLHWTAVDPKTRKATDRTVDAPIPIRWSQRAVQELVESPRVVRVAGGDYTFAERTDSILLRGPDRRGVVTTRFVGFGVPVTSTRNGEYLLAVRRTEHDVEAVVYYLVLHHAAFHSSCDRNKFGL